MDPYRDLYFKLFNAITDLISQLQVLQQEAEELYLAWEEKTESSVLFLDATERIKRKTPPGR
jgi:hypothetical protein